MRFDSPAVYGIVISAVAAVNLLGAVRSGLWKVRRRGVLILLVSAVLGLCVASIGLMTTVWGIAGVLLLAGAAAGMVNVHVGAWVMQRIDTAVRAAE